MWRDQCLQRQKITFCLPTHTKKNKKHKKKNDCWSHFFSLMRKALIITKILTKRMANVSPENLRTSNGHLYKVSTNCDGSRESWAMRKMSCLLTFPRGLKINAIDYNEMILSKYFFKWNDWSWFPKLNETIFILCINFRKELIVRKFNSLVNLKSAIL